MKNEILEKTNVFEIYRELLEHESSYIVVVAGKKIQKFLYHQME